VTCDARQIQALQRRYGVLDAELASELEAHLDVCPTCAAFVAAERELEERMPTPSSPDWTTLSTQLGARLAQERRRRWVVGAALLASLSLFAAGMAGQGLMYFLFMTLLVLMVVIPAVLRRPQPVAVEANVDLFAELRRDLERRIRRARVSSVLLLAAVGVFLPRALPVAEAPTPPLLALLAASVVLLGIGASQWLVRLPRLRAELEQLR